MTISAALRALAGWMALYFFRWAYKFRGKTECCK
jgi:hypothetical protein